MGTISVSLPSDGSTAEVSDYNNPINTIVDEINGGLDNSNISASAAIDPTKLASTGFLGAWSSWTPTYTNFSLGNGTLTYARYVQIGKTVHFRIKIIWGSTTSASGNITISMPVAPAATYTDVSSDAVEARGMYRDVSASTIFLGGVRVQGSTFVPFAFSVNGTSIVTTSTTGTAPFTWTSTDIYALAGSYEAA